MNVELLTKTEHIADMERAAAYAALTCRANTDRDFVAAEVLNRIITAGHESVLEHINLTYSIKGISRALLQEVARHRHISLSVESTRHTLRKILKTDTLEEYCGDNDNLLEFAANFAEFARKHRDMPNDELKYYVPEFLPTNLVLTSNIRELRHIIKLRSAPAALKEFRELARAMYEAVPEQFKYLLKDCVHNEAGNDTN